MDSDSSDSIPSEPSDRKLAPSDDRSDKKANRDIEMIESSYDAQLSGACGIEQAEESKTEGDEDPLETELADPASSDRELEGDYIAKVRSLGGHPSPRGKEIEIASVDSNTDEGEPRQL